MLRISVMMVVLPIVCFCRPSESDSVQQKTTGFSVFPFVFYTPETKLAGGFATIYYFRSEENASSARPSNLTMSFVYTQNNQVVVDLSPDLYSTNEEYHLTGYFAYSIFPNKFWGIGNGTPDEMEETYTARSGKVSFNLQKKIFSELSGGIQYAYEYDKVVEFEENRKIAVGERATREGAGASGIGALMTWDSRDNIFYSTTGGFYQFSTLLYGSGVRSDYTFTRYTLEIREFVPLWREHVFAVQGYANLIDGDPPFQMLSSLGGQRMMRGYYEGRYRDKSMVTLQAEYRAPLWWRVGIVAFGAMGDVAGKLSEFHSQEFKYSLGFGLRFLLIPEEKINLRMDLGYAKGSSGLYFTLGEAF